MFSYTRYTVNADKEAMDKCVDEKTEAMMSKCMGISGGPSGPGEGDAPPEGAFYARPTGGSNARGFSRGRYARGIP